jgi:radical SAM superfamily enzyme YgiQ (UPF0313 family)
MKITYIYPAIGKKAGKPYIATWKKMEPLAVALLKALTPADVETEFFDDRLELIDYERATDLVAITVEMYTARRVYDIAARYRERGIPVVMGGYHATLCPEEVLEHADAVVVGNAEGVWAQVMADFAAGTPQRRYDGKPGFTSVIPDKSIFRGKGYAPISLVETGRGCSFSCEFCAITACYGGRYHRRPVADVVEEIRQDKRTFFFFVDDNIVANPAYAIELFQAITPLKIRWTAQATLTIGNNKELQYWMKKSGCDVILIGYESLDASNLKQMNKDWSLSLGERDRLTEQIHQAGISIYATFVFGFDHESPETFAAALAFAQRHRFFFAAFNHLLPFPGTPLHHRLLSEGRLLGEQWWLERGYSYGDIPYQPKTMTPEELSRRCVEARRAFFRLPTIARRGWGLLSRSRNPMLHAIFWSQNLNLRLEVEGKYGLPLGGGLDEWPK